MAEPSSENQPMLPESGRITSPAQVGANGTRGNYRQPNWAKSQVEALVQDAKSITLG